MEANVFVHLEPDSGQIIFLTNAYIELQVKIHKRFFSLSHRSGQKTKLIPIVEIGEYDVKF